MQEGAEDTGVGAGAVPIQQEGKAALVDGTSSGEQAGAPETHAASDTSQPHDSKQTSATHVCSRMWSCLCSTKGRAVLAMLFGAVLVIGGLWYMFTRSDATAPLEYASTWSLVPSSISQSAMVRITLPEGTLLSNAASAVSFVPEVKGSFELSDDARVLLYKPAEPLALDTFYSVVIEEGDLSLRGDFKAVEDPRVLTILPTADEESHEESKVSILFNRPMVPLTVLSERDTFEIPAELDPPTPGRWVWKSTRLLQFIPDTRLLQSQRYAVRLKDGLSSIDGLAVPAAEHTFTTRTLKRTGASEGVVVFNKPYRMSFNMPVNLEEAERALSVTNMTTNESVPFTVRYGQAKEKKGRSFLGLALFSPPQDADASVLEVSPVKDMHGREGLWDIETTYRVSMSTARPAEGTIAITEPFEGTFSVPGIVKDVRATSPRSSHVRQDLFDTEGELELHFYEPVDLGKTELTVKGLREVRYGTTCKLDEDGNAVYKAGSNECEKEDDHKVLIVRLTQGSLAPGESTELALVRVTVDDGTVITGEPVRIPITSYPAPTLYRTNVDAAKSASLTTLELCTNVPLQEPEEGTYRTVLETNGYMVFPGNPWERSYLVQEGDWILRQGSACTAGEFRTLVNYGLHPRTAYSLALALTDDFGQPVTTTLAFTTAPASGSYARLAALQPMYNVTIPGRTKLTYAAENLGTVTMNICKVRAPDFLRVIERGPSEYIDEWSRPAPCTEERTAVIDLPDTYFVNNYFQIDLASYVSDPRGQYIVTLYHPQFSEVKDGPRYLRTFLSVTTLAVAQKAVGWYRWGEEENTPRTVEPNASDLYWVVRASTLAPIAGAKVTPYESTSLWDRDIDIRAREEVTTGSDGVARAKSAMAVRGAVVTVGNESAVVSSWADDIGDSWGSGGESRTYLYTDRPIYRPGDVVHMKGIDRVGYDGRWRSVPDVPAQLTVRNSIGDTVHTEELPQSTYGTFNTSFTIPQNAPLGTWYFDAFNGNGSFDVEEYVPAAFKVDLTAQEEEYRAGETLELSVNADYYFGMPVAGATVEYDILAQDYHFDRFTDGWWSFGEGWYYCYDCGYGDSFIKRGKLTLDAEGAGMISLPLDFTALFKDPYKEGSKLFTVNVRVKDESGRQVGGTKSLIVHRGLFYLGVRTDPYFSGKNTPVTLTYKSVNTKGEPLSVSDIERTISRIEWRSYKRREVDGGFYWHSEEVRTEVSKETRNPDRDGNASEQYTFDQEGQYEVAISAVDEAGNTVRATTRLYIYGDGQVSVRETNNTSLTVRTDRTDYAPGDTGQALFESPFHNAKALVTVERGSIYSYSIIDVKGSIAAAPFMVDRDSASNGFVSVTLLSSAPEVRHGSASYSVSRAQKELTVDVVPDKERYLPGEKVSLTVTTKDAGGNAVPAEVSVSVVDLSVLALKGNPKKDPLLFFYGDIPLAVTTRHNLKNVLFERDVPTGTKGGGGGAPEDLASKKRGDFRDTAHWEARVTTDESGQARVTFTLPDNLTTWQIESLGVTEDLLLGVDYKEIMTMKPLMAVPKKPRFILPGDSFELGVQVFNNTDRAESVDVSLSSNTLTLDKDERTVRVQPGQSALVYFEAEAPRTVTDGSHTVTFSAAYPGATDVVEQSFPVKRNITFETFATAGMTTGNLVSEYVYVPAYVIEGEGELTVRARATLAGMLTDGVDYMAGYPYGCAEQIASRLASLSIARRMREAFGTSSLEGMDPIENEQGEEVSLDAALDEGVKQLAALQNPDGGFTWYPGYSSSYYLTLEVLRALTTLHDAGVSVPPTMVGNAAAFAVREISAEPYLIDTKDAIATLALSLGHSSVPLEYRSVPRQYVERIAQNKLELEKLSSGALGYLAIATAMDTGYSNSVKKTFMDALTNRVSLDARGAYVKQGDAFAHELFETPEKNNGLYLKAAALRGGDDPLSHNILRWLMARRTIDGSWQTTNATYAVLDGILTHALERREQDASYTLTLSLAGRERATHAVSKENVFAELEERIPLDDVSRERMVPVTLLKREGGEGSVYFDLALRYALPPEYVAPRDEGITVERSYFTVGPEPQAVTEARVGDVLKGVLTITVPEEYSAVSIEDYIPAGLELVNERLATEQVAAETVFDEYGNMIVTRKNDCYSFWCDWYDPSPGPRPFPAGFTEMRDDRAFAFADAVRPGVYTFEYHVRALIPGTFAHMPATVSQMYNPEIFGRTAGATFTVRE